MRFLEVQNLYVNLGEFVLRDVTFSVDKGDYVCIIGPTGVGKSILLETIAGLYKPKRGRILLDGEDITFLPPEKRHVSVVYQDYMLFPHMTVLDNIAYGLRKRVKDRSKVIEEVKRVAEMLGIEHLLHRKPTTLSGGEKQRVALARALVVRPKLLLMDEPFSALDVKTREKLRSLVKKAVASYGVTVLHVTHDFDDVWSLANKVLVMKEGRVLQYGTVEEVFSKPAPGFVADFVGVNVLEGTVVENEGELAVVDVGGLRIYSVDRAKVGERVRVLIRPENVIVSKKPLENCARNTFRGKIEELEKRGQLVRLTLSIGGLKLRSLLTPNSCEVLELREGDEVFVSFKEVSARLSR